VLFRSVSQQSINRES